MATRLPNAEECRQILGEHETYCELVTTLYRVLAEHNEPVLRISHLVENLRTRLEAHFRDEEQGGVLEEVARRAPQYSDKTGHLLAEHDVFRAQLKHLESLLSTEEGLTPAVRNQLETEFRAFHDRLMHHESEENALLQETFGQDLGDKD
jgi:iron-sulfur cluster repair protein YtfE (RIC family)